MKVQIISDYTPVYAKEGDSGADVRAAHFATIAPGKCKTIRTGLRMAFPADYDCQIRPRSGLSMKGILVALGTVDSGYRGEVGVTIYNLGDSAFTIMEGDRIGQLVFTPIVRAEFEHVLELPDSERSEAGFGSTGVE